MLETNKIILSYDPETEQEAAENRAKALVYQGYSIKPIKVSEGKYQKIKLVRYDSERTAKA